MATEAGVPPAGAVLPDAGGLRELAEWSPRFGVISVCFDAEPGDRSERWRIELRDRLRALEVPEDADDRHERRLALERASERVLARLPRDAPPPGGRGQVGYVSLDDDGERWYSSQVPVPRFDVSLGHRPHLRPLVELADRARAFAVAVLSSERVRLFEFAGGWIEEASAFELETFELDWRERKAQRVVHPSRGQASSSSGKDQYGQRLDANRERFMKQAGEQARAWVDERERPEVLVFGDRALASRFSAAIKDVAAIHCLEETDLISEPTHAIAERVVEALPELDRARQRGFVADALDQARAGGRGALGVEETAQALGEGRVERLLIDAERDFGGRPELTGPLAISDADAADIAEWMIETAIRTSASVTPLRDEAAEDLAAEDGVGALLRY
jgi:Bacterial archaeo-eukaryotic release factor family 10